MWSSRTIVEVTYVKLEELNASAGALVEHDGVIEASEFKTNFDTGANGELEIKASELRAQVGEGSLLRLEGSARVFEAVATTGGRLKAGDLISEVVDVSANTGGQATVHASEVLEASATMGGSVQYFGDPEKVSESETLGGSIRG